MSFAPPTTAGLFPVSFLVALAFAGCAAAPRLSPEALRAASYRLGGDGAVRFVDGAYERDSVRFGQVDLVAYGDLDGDGTDDAVTFLSEKGPGPELYLSMEAFLDRAGAPVHAAHTRLGDRIAITAVTIAGGTVRLGLIVPGPDDAPCCPSLRVDRFYRLDHDDFLLLHP